MMQPGRAGQDIYTWVMIDDLHLRRERWGISYYLVHEPYLDAFAPIVARLAGR